MTDTAAALLLCAAACAAASIGNVSDTNTTDREPLEFYPNWVPFKNKHGDELGEFVDVTPKAKVKKRLAPPAHFLLRAVAEPEGDDYYEKGQGESDGEDYFEKKDWSDLHRPEVPSDPSKPTKINDLSDIDGIINIITKESPSLAEAIDNSRNEKRHDEKKLEPAKQEDVKEKPDTNDIAVQKVTKKPDPEHKYEDDIDYEDSPHIDEKQKPETEEEKAENEAKKKMILDSVDELKERHAEEQRSISEKMKEEEFDQEVYERDQIRVRKQQDKYADRHKKRRGKVTPTDYEEYDERGSWRDKYNIRSDKTTAEPKRTTELKNAPRRLSVFRNPNSYIIEDDNESTETTTKPYKTSQAPRRFSSKYVLTTTERNLAADDPDTIQIVPKNVIEGEPVLFVPKLKNKRKRKLRTTTVAPDSSAAETVEDKLEKKLSTKAYNPLSDVTAPETTEDYKTTALGSDDYKSTGPGNDDTTRDGEEYKTTAADSDDYKTTAADNGDYQTTADDNEIFKTTLAKYPTPTLSSKDAVSTNSDAVTDAVPASSDHKKEEPKEYHVEKGGGHEHHSSHEAEHEEHGKKAYEGLHKDSKTKKGHHDKEDHIGKYEDHGGFDKKHHDEKKHFGEHHHQEHGKKHAKYEESGKHSKGHSTKGSHDIHKKEEYEKNVEFFEEEGDSEEEEKHGGFHQDKQHSAGGKYKKDNHEALHHERKKGESGHFDKGGHHAIHKGHKLSAGHDSHGKRGGAHHGAEGHQAGKKWIYHHGFPAKTANLVVIDRRGDKYTHGPSYYG